MEAFDIVILAMIAAFIVLRLRSELGKKTGDEPTSGGGMPRDMESGPYGGSARGPSDDDRVIDAYGRPVEDGEATGQVVDLSTDPAVRSGLQAIRRADSSFDSGQFIDGASGAYRMILEAFWGGDRDTLKGFLSDEVYDQFSGALDARESTGQTLDNRILDIESAEIESAEMRGRVAEIDVCFKTDLIAVTRDADGAVIDGSLSDSVEVTDIWTFARDTRSRDPNWELVATRSA